MRKFTACLAFLALTLTAFGADSVATITESSLNVKGQQVISSGNTTDAPAGTSGWILVTSGDLYFGPGTTNETILAWGVTRTTAGDTTSVPTGAIRRTINATILAYGNGSTVQEAVKAADVTVAFTKTLDSVAAGAHTFAAGNGYFAIATVEYATGTDKDVVYVYLASATATTFGTGIVVDTQTGTRTGKFYFALGYMWYENGYFYLIWVAQNTETSEDTIFLNAVATNGTLLQQTKTTVATSIGVTIQAANVNKLGSGATGRGSSGNPNAASDYVIVSWKDTASPKNVKYALVNRTSGVAAAAKTLATEAPSADPVLAYAIGGIIGSNYTYGAAISTASTTGGVTTYNLTAKFNNTDTVTNLTFTFASIFATGAENYPTIAWSGQNSTGFAIIASWPISATSKYYAYQSYLANGTVDVAQKTIATQLDTTSSIFQDTQGALWIGYYIVDTNSYIKTAYVARALETLNTSSGNVLVSIIAFVSMIMMSLFMF